MNPSTALARVLVDEFARCGVTEAVLAPGSRSGPLALALLAEPRIRLHVRIDERSAAFLAVGLARVSGAPAILACTSGTAAANLHPAVAEADAGHVPLIVLTADRPPELRGTGANQTIDQIKLFGAAVRLFTEVGVPEAIPGQVGYWRSLAGRAYAAAADGPVHLNVSLREPLVPDGDGGWPEPLDGRSGGRPWVRGYEPQEAFPPPLVDVLGGSVPERGAVVVGDGATQAAARAAVRLAETVGWPLFAEPTSGARAGPNAIPAYPLLVGRPDLAEPAEVVVTVGRPGLSRDLLAWTARAGRHLVVDPHSRWADPTRTADRVLTAVPHASEWKATGPYTRDLVIDGERVGINDTDALMRLASAPAPWLARWRAAGAQAAAAVETVLADEAEFTEPAIARALATALPPDALLVSGPSRPIRDLELTLPADAGLRVLANRGANGIDGVVSTAIGAALAHQAAEGRPAALLLGDLTYLHDRNGLILGPDEPRPDLTLVVIDNGGGGIFSMLPQAGVDGFERVFGTPHGVDLAADAAAVGVGYTNPTDAAELAAALRPASGLRLVHVRTDRSATVGVQERLRKAVAAAIVG